MYVCLVVDFLIESYAHIVLDRLPFECSEMAVNSQENDSMQISQHRKDPGHKHLPKGVEIYPPCMSPLGLPRDEA